MAAKRTKAPTDDGLDELFEGIGDDSGAKKSTKAKGAASKPRNDKGKDILADLESELDKPERPHTPRIKDTKRTSTATPPPAASRLSEDKPSAAVRKSADSARSIHASFTPSATSSELQDAEKQGTVEQTQAAPAASSGGSWWGGFYAQATATVSGAMKQAEAIAKEIQQNEEAMKWVEQAQGRVGALKGLGDDLRTRAMPTWANILHTLAPPISSHERLLIHTTHDIVGYPSLEPLIYGVFSRVMSQVEGGDLLVIQRGHENTARRASGDGAFFGGGHSSSAGWRDGPWWRQVDSPRDLSAVKGLPEGTKLCRVNAESYSDGYFSANGGIEEAQRRAVEPVSEANPVRTSNIFLAVQAIVADADSALFAGSAAGEAEKEASPVVDDSGAADTQVCFAVYVLDPVHNITFSTVSQGLPQRWVRWMEAPSPLTPASESEPEAGNSAGAVPDDIREIIDSGAVDPREWVAEWIEETLSLAVGVVAQRYVARRMGVGEGGLGKGKQKIETLVQEGAGEAARAGIL